MSANPTCDELRPATDLRRRMIEDLQRSGMVEGRQRHYVRAVRLLAEHYHKPPDQITDEELRQYCLNLNTDKEWARNMTIFGIKFFYERTLKRKWPRHGGAWPPSALERRMIEDLQLAGMSERTQQMYVRAVRLLAEHHKKSPDQITEDELRRCFLYIKNVKKWSRTGITIALCGIKFFFEKTLKRKWPFFDVVRPHAEKKLPVILSREEVREILGKVRLLRYRICLQTFFWREGNCLLQGEFRIALPVCVRHLYLFGETAVSSAEEQLARDNRNDGDLTDKVIILLSRFCCDRSLSQCLRKPNAAPEQKSVRLTNTFWSRALLSMLVSLK